jgi:WD40 repeat protein
MIAVAFLENQFVLVLSRQGAEPIQVLEVPMDAPQKGSGGIGQVCFSPDGEVLVAATGGRGWPDFQGRDSVMSVWNTADWTLRASFAADAHNVNSLAISPDSRTVAASCHRTGVVKVWNMPAASRPGKAAPAAEINDLVTQLDSDSFARREAAQARLGEIGAAATEALQRVVKLGTPEQRIRAERLLRPITGGDIRPKDVLRGSGGDLQSVAFSPDGGSSPSARWWRSPGTCSSIAWEGDRPRSSSRWRTAPGTSPSAPTASSSPPAAPTAR